MRNKMRKAVVVPLVCAVLAGTAGTYNGGEAQAAAGPKMSKARITLNKGASKKVTVKNKAGASNFKWSVSNKKVAQIKAKGAVVTVKGKKAGSARLVCRLRYKGKSRKLTCKITVKAPAKKTEKKTSPSAVPATATAAPSPTKQPAASENPGTPGKPSPTASPAATATLEPIPVMDNIDANATYDIVGSLKGAFGRFFGNVGTSVNIFQIDPSKSFFEDDHGEMFEFTKKQYNSITPENETKPCHLLNMGTDFSDYFATDFKAQTMPVSEAKANPYYYVPDSYQEAVCPKINYEKFDTFLKKAAENGMRIRFHAFVWHQQTPQWLFKENFDAEGKWVSPAVMNARMEYYIKSVITYICKKEEENGWGDVVYCYDVANEYFHNNDGKDKEDKYIKSFWDEVYYPDNPINVNSGNYEQTTQPEYVKKAFTYAREVLDSYGKQGVTLFYNDYNTYQVTDKILALVEYINKEKKLCDGVGMQSHLDVGYPTVDSYSKTLQTFLDCAYINEVQITELDVTTYAKNDTALQKQMTYYYDLMKSILALSKEYPGKITGLTFWGLYDSFSWRRDGKPLLFDSVTRAKGVYYKVLQAAAEAAE